MRDLPGSVLFACTQNALRSPMAAGLLRYIHGNRVYVESCGVRPGELDPFAVAVMDEIGVDIAKHKPRRFEELEDGFFDVVVSLSPEAQHKAVELTRASAVELEFWNTIDPSFIEGSREQRLEAYRRTRDLLLERIRERFPLAIAPST
jgi:protein-tyrosine-phosphatase